MVKGILAIGVRKSKAECLYQPSAVTDLITSTKVEAVVFMKFTHGHAHDRNVTYLLQLFQIFKMS